MSSNADLMEAIMVGSGEDANAIEILADSIWGAEESDSENEYSGKGKSKKSKKQPESDNESESDDENESKQDEVDAKTEIEQPNKKPEIDETETEQPNEKLESDNESESEETPADEPELVNESKSDSDDDEMYVTKKKTVEVKTEETVEKSEPVEVEIEDEVELNAEPTAELNPDIETDLVVSDVVVEPEPVETKVIETNDTVVESENEIPDADTSTKVVPEIVESETENKIFVTKKKHGGKVIKSKSKSPKKKHTHASKKQPDNDKLLLKEITENVGQIARNNNDIFMDKPESKQDKKMETYIEKMDTEKSDDDFTSNYFVNKDEIKPDIISVPSPKKNGALDDGVSKYVTDFISAIEF